MELKNAGKQLIECGETRGENRNLMDKKESRVMNILSVVFCPILIYYFVSNLFVLAGLSFAEIIRTKAFAGNLPEGFWFYTETFIKMAGMALGGVAVYPYFQREKSGKEQKSLSFRTTVILVLSGAGLSLGLNFLFAVTGFTESSEQYSRVAETQFALPLWLACIFYGVLSPIVEEIVFRGVVYNALCRSASNSMGIVGSALLFGAFHGNVVQMVYAALMGTGMAFFYQKYKNLSAAILFHGAANMAVYLMVYFSDV